MDKKNKKETKKLSLEEEYIKHQQDALFREVDEQVHIENMRKFWKKYGNFFIAGAFLIMLGVGGFELFKRYKQLTAYKVSSNYLNALMLVSVDKNDDAAAAFEKIAMENKNGLADFASLYVTELKKSKSDEYMSLADKEKTFPPLKEFLRLSYAYQNIGTKSEDDINAILDSIENKTAWKGAVMEIKALAALNAGKKEKAIDLMTVIVKDPEVSAPFKNRVNKVLRTIQK